MEEQRWGWARVKSLGSRLAGAGAGEPAVAPLGQLALEGALGPAQRGEGLVAAGWSA